MALPRWLRWLEQRLVHQKDWEFLPVGLWISFLVGAPTVATDVSLTPFLSKINKHILPQVRILKKWILYGSDAKFVWLLKLKCKISKKDGTAGRFDPFPGLKMGMGVMRTHLPLSEKSNTTKLLSLHLPRTQDVINTCWEHIYARQQSAGPSLTSSLLTYALQVEWFPCYSWHRVSGPTSCVLAILSTNLFP